MVVRRIETFRCLQKETEAQACKICQAFGSDDLHIGRAPGKARRHAGAADNPGYARRAVPEQGCESIGWQVLQSNREARGTGSCSAPADTKCSDGLPSWRPSALALGSPVIRYASAEAATRAARSRSNVAA